MKEVVGYPLPFGVSEREGAVNFSIAVGKEKQCALCIYKSGMEEPEFKVELPESDAQGEVRFTSLPESRVKGMEYNYEIDGKLVVDPYVKSICKSDMGNRGLILQDAYDWEGDKPLEIPYHDVIAYSLHVRGFTKHASSNVKKKGTFQGIIEKLPYLQELGINQIHCMPVYAFEENIQYKNYWGYGEAFCFAVKNAYAAGSCAAKELKDMVKACHKSGVEVVLNLPFTDKTPKLLMIDCLRYYVMEYHIDGFVLNPYVAPMQSILSDPILGKTKILQNRDDFQNTMRSFLRGDMGTIPGVMWWLRQTTKESRSCNYITRHTGFTLADLVSYNEKHNELNGENNCDGPSENFSWNCGTEGPTNKRHILALRGQQMRNAMFLLMSAQGTPCILAGDEFGNTQNGNNNVYCQDNEIAWLDWRNLETEREFFEYVKALIALRKAYPILRAASPLSGSDKTGCGVPDVSYHGENAWQISERKMNRQLGVYYHDENDTDCFIAYNMYSKEHTFALPTLNKKKQWYQVFSTADAQGKCEEKSVENQKEIVVGGRTIVMFFGK